LELGSGLNFLKKVTVSDGLSLSPSPHCSFDGDDHDTEDDEKRDASR